MRYGLKTLLIGTLLVTTGCATSSQSPSQSYLPTYWPAMIQYPVTSAFGPRYDPYTKKPKPHNGVDIAAPHKSDVFASGSGKVIYAGKTGNGYGNMVGIDHGNGLETWYAHLSARKTKEGKWVNQGDVIGRVGKSGRATAPHLHFEVRHQGKPVDPAFYIMDEQRLRMARDSRD